MRRKHGGRPEQNGQEDQERRLREWFREEGLDPQEIHCLSDRRRERIAALLSLAHWVCAYGACPDREGLMKKGFLYPPVQPSFDEGSDWLRFEKWIRREPLTWNLSSLAGELKPVEMLSDEEVGRATERVTGTLEERGVVVDLAEGVPQRLVYDYLRGVALKETFEVVGEGWVTHIGCRSFCPECFQRPWCDIGQEAVWPEDEEAHAGLAPQVVQ